jgi:hypothetical protein
MLIIRTLAEWRARQRFLKLEYETWTTNISNDRSTVQLESTRWMKKCVKRHFTNKSENQGLTQVNWERFGM